MKHADFHAAVRSIAAGRYFSTRVEATEHKDGPARTHWSAYVECRKPEEGRGDRSYDDWTETYSSPEDVLKELRGEVNRLPSVGIDSLDPTPEVSS